MQFSKVVFQFKPVSINVLSSLSIDKYILNQNFHDYCNSLHEVELICLIASVFFYKVLIAEVYILFYEYYMIKTGVSQVSCWKKINKRIILLNLYSKNDPDINSVGKVIYIEKIQDLKALDKSPNMLKSRGE